MNCGTSAYLALTHTKTGRTNKGLLLRPGKRKPKTYRIRSLSAFPNHKVRAQPNRNYSSNDVVQTPPEMARQLVEHFNPRGRVLEPCRGQGAFFDLLPEADWCEILEGRDFLALPVPSQPYDWVITNPPWSLVRKFLGHAMKVSDNVVFLITINHLWTKARVRDIAAAGFGLKEIVLVDMPSSFPQSGFQLGAIHVARGWKGDVKLTNLGAAPKLNAGSCED